MRYPTGMTTLDQQLYGGLPGGMIIILDLTAVGRQNLQKLIAPEDWHLIDSWSAASELFTKVAEDPTRVYFCQHANRESPDEQMRMAKLWGDASYLAMRLHRAGGALVFVERPRYNSILWAARVHVYETRPDRFSVVKGFPLVLAMMDADQGYLTPNQRWEAGLPNDPRSVEIYEILKAADKDDYFCWKSGGDGDNGEHLMYQLDSWFAEKDRIATDPDIAGR